MARLARVIIPGLPYHVTQRGNGGQKVALTDLAPARHRFSRFADLLEGDDDTAATSRLRKGESVGSPIGSESFLAALEAQTQRRLRPPRRGPKPTMIQQDSRRIKCTFTVIRKPVRNLQMTARENYGYIFPKTGLSVRFKIPSVWVAAPR